MIPMLARTKGPKFNQYPCYIQPKLNGIRALYQQGIFQSRDEKIWKPGILRHLHEELESVKFHGPILDGELYVHGWKLQRINGAVAVNRKEPRHDTHEVCFHVFDVVDPSRKFQDRWFELYHGLMSAELPHIKVVPTDMANNDEMVEQFFHHFTAHGYEGIMLRPNGLYEFGEHIGRGGTPTQYRSKTLWKYKQWEDGEFRCIGVTPGEGKADIGIGALVLADLNVSEPWPDVPYFKVGTGFDDAERVAFATNPPIGKLIRVRYLCLTDDGIPFNPSFIAVMS